jgi:flagellar hook assembly protein FlgD
MIIPVTMHVIDTNNNMIPNIDGKLLITSYPNPFNQITCIEYEIKRTCQVQAWIFDIHGKKIKSLISETLPAGRYRLIWNGENDNGERLSSGIYYCTMQTGEKTGALKLILIR